MARQLGYVSSIISQATNTSVGWGVATGTPTVTTITDGGVSYQSCSFTASSTLVVTGAGFFEVLLISGGGGGASGGDGGGGGSGAIPYQGTIYLTPATYTVTVGGGGGGKGDVATAGGKDVTKIDEALETAREKLAPLSS